MLNILNNITEILEKVTEKNTNFTINDFLSDEEKKNIKDILSINDIAETKNSIKNIIIITSILSFVCVAFCCLCCFCYMCKLATDSARNINEIID